MTYRWPPLIAVVSLSLATTLCDAEESSRYLGGKLEFVLQNVDPAYVERNQKQLGNRYKKAFRDLAEHLVRKYPTLEIDLLHWLDQHYSTEMAETGTAGPNEHRLTFDALLVLDREDEHFRGQLLAHIRAKYPSLFGEIACFLRDKHPAALREVLRMTLRMTSCVNPCNYAAYPEADETRSQPPTGTPEMPTQSR